VTVMTDTDSPESVIEEFQTRLEQAGLSKYVEVELSRKNGGISLDRICSKERGKGYFKQAMEILASLCDESCKDIELIPRPLDDNTCQERLEGGYARLGFVKVPGGDSVMRRIFSSKHRMGRA